MPKSIDPKSFIIGVLSTIVVCMAMGADKVKSNWIPNDLQRKNWDQGQQWAVCSVTAAEWSKREETKKGWEPFAVTKGDKEQIVEVWCRQPMGMPELTPPIDPLEAI